MVYICVYIVTMRMATYLSKICFTVDGLCVYTQICVCVSVNVIDDALQRLIDRGIFPSLETVELFGVLAFLFGIRINFSGAVFVKNSSFCKLFLVRPLDVSFTKILTPIFSP